MSKPTDKPITVRLPAILHERIFREAEEQGTTMSGVVRGILEHQISVSELADQIDRLREELRSLVTRSNNLSKRAIVTLEKSLKFLIEKEKYREIIAAVDEAMSN